MKFKEEIVHLKKKGIHKSHYSGLFNVLRQLLDFLFDKKKRFRWRNVLFNLKTLDYIIKELFKELDNLT